ncbi:MAG: iron-containing alcohol dehydrogenase, partial [Eubacteriales bacterium]
MHPFCRSFHLGLHIAATILPWKSPIILEGNTVYADIGKLISKNRCTFIVTDSVIQNLALTKPLLDYLDQEGYPYVVYDKVSPNPTVANIEEALALYHKHDCHTLIAFGGGSPMDCGKGLLARVARPKKSLKKMKGLFKVLRKIRPLIAIPTTAGTGSETTVCAVVSDDTTKYVINDLCLIPPYAAFIPELTCSLPPHVTATTGMDALVHAVESYIGVINGKQTRKDALQAVTLIHKHLLTAYEDGNNLEARREM